MSFDESFVRQLEKLLKRETALYIEYLDILNKERNQVTAFNANQIQQMAVRRKLLTEALKESHERRIELLSRLPDSAGKKLTDLIESQAPERFRASLLSSALKLRELVEESQRQGSSLQQVVQFALNTVNGSLSLFSQASQNVSRQYNTTGKISESYNPKSSRSDTVLKQA